MAVINEFGAPSPGRGVASAISRGRDAALRKRKLELLRDEAAKEGMFELKGFADWLNRKGYLTAQGKRWTVGNVRNVLRVLISTES